MPLTVWLVEDDVTFRRALADTLGDAADVWVTGTHDSVEAALVALRVDPPPDVVLCDIGLPGVPGTEGARQLKAAAPTTQIVMLTIHEGDDVVFEALCAGASGYLLKSASAARIVNAVREVHAGGVSFTPPVARRVLRLFQREAAAPEDYGLSEREREVLRLLAEGLTQRRLAEALHLSPHTVDTHLRNVYAKLHVRTATAAVAKALRERLVR